MDLPGDLCFALSRSGLNPSASPGMEYNRMEDDVMVRCHHCWGFGSECEETRLAECEETYKKDT